VPTREIAVERFSVVSAKPFKDVMAAVDAAIGHPDMAILRRQMTAAATHSALEEVVRGAVGSSDLMEFVRLDMGEVLRKPPAAKVSPNLRLLVGNPIIMRQMAEHVPDAASYAPVTILIDERTDGVHLSYDRMASFLVSYQNPEALRVARDLDAKVEALLTAASH
jgi:uncharacterized protein (DUF302 family)